ncbi:Metabotropic GABA-B receptor subtype 3A [Chamberlinius hualienensis]
MYLLDNDTGIAVDAFFHAVYCRPQMVMVLGSSSSPVTEKLAQIVPVWNVLQVSFGSTSPALSDQKSFPYFYRTVAPDTSYNLARSAFVSQFQWDTVAIFCQNDNLFTLGINDLVQQLESANVSIGATIMFASGDYKERLYQLKEMDFRVIFASFRKQLAYDLFCEVYHLGMYGSDYVWMFHDELATPWWNSVHFTTKDVRPNCTITQLKAAVDGAFFVQSYNRIVGSGHSVSDRDNEDFVKELRKSSVKLTKFVPQTYDAVWAIALTLQRAQSYWNFSLREFNFRRHDMANVFRNFMGNLSFEGVSGLVSFKGPDRVSVACFYQNQGGQLKTVALHFPYKNELDFNCSFCSAIHWSGGQIPVARRRLKFYIKTIGPQAFLVISILALLGITFAASFLVFNVYNRGLKYIKLSSPKLNNMAVVGCIMVYLAIILLGIDHKMLVSESHFPLLCMSRALLLSAGFSLAFGAMFTKTYRVHQIFIRASSGVIKRKLLQDKRLIILVCALLLIDCVILTLWIVIDPMQRQLRNLTVEISHTERDVIYLPQVEECQSKHIEKWLGGLYVYKGLLLVVGVYMAWETRNVKIPALNDSQYIGMNVYNVVLTSVIVVVMANLIPERKTLAFLTVTSLILASTSTTLCLLFLPKIHTLLKSSNANEDPIVESLGLKIESNTRRFVINERRELYYRAEVQNRVFKKDLHELTLEVARLERLQNMDDMDAASLSDKKHMPKVFTKKEKPKFFKTVITTSGPGIETLCANTLSQFIYDGTLPKTRRSFDVNVLRGPGKPVVRHHTIVSAPSKTTVKTTKSGIERRLSKCTKYFLPEIIVSSSSDDVLNIDQQRTSSEQGHQSLLIQNPLDGDVLDVNSSHSYGELLQRSELLSLKRKRMSLSVQGLKATLNIGRHGGSDRALTSKKLSNNNSSGLSTLMTDVLTKTASQSLVMLDFNDESSSSCNTCSLLPQKSASEMEIRPSMEEQSSSCNLIGQKIDIDKKNMARNNRVSKSGPLLTSYQEELGNSENEEFTCPNIPTRRYASMVTIPSTSTVTPPNASANESDEVELLIVSPSGKLTMEKLAPKLRQVEVQLHTEDCPNLAFV